MYLVPVKIKLSSIEGKGVFIETDIPKDTIVWQYTQGHDRRMSAEEFGDLDEETRESLGRVAYLSDESGMWVMPPDDDPACYTNHSETANLKCVVDSKLSDEPLFVANRDIKAGEEITDDYLEFDKNAGEAPLSWLMR